MPLLLARPARKAGAARHALVQGGHWRGFFTAGDGHGPGVGLAANADSDEARNRLREEISREEQDMPAEIYPPKLFTGDTTAETLQMLMVKQGERMAVLTDEAGIFLVMAGLYSGGNASLDVFLQGHAGSPVRVDRADREAYTSQQPAGRKPTARPAADARRKRKSAG